MAVRQNSNPALFPGMGRPRKLTYPAILVAAEQVMEDEGFSALSLRSLAQKLGVSHGTLYTYVARIEDVESDVLKAMAATLPAPQSTHAGALRAEFYAFMQAARALMVRHPRVIFPPVGSTAWVTFAALTLQWRDALARFGNSEVEIGVAYQALVSFCSHLAELERTSGPGFEGQNAAALEKHHARRLHATTDRPVFDVFFDTILNSLLPGLCKEAAPGARASAIRPVSAARPRGRATRASGRKAG